MEVTYLTLFSKDLFIFFFKAYLIEVEPDIHGKIGIKFKRIFKR